MPGTVQRVSLIELKKTRTKLRDPVTPKLLDEIVNHLTPEGKEMSSASNPFRIQVAFTIGYEDETQLYEARFFNAELLKRFTQASIEAQEEFFCAAYMLMKQEEVWTIELPLPKWGRSKGRILEVTYRREKDPRPDYEAKRVLETRLL